MAFTTPNSFTANTAALASEVNENFAAIAAELNAFPTDGAIKAAAIDTTQIKDKAVTKDKLADALLVTETETIASNDNDNTIPTCAAVLNHIATVNNFTPAAYAGGETCTFPNGMIIKTGYKAGTGDKTITFATPFPNGVVSAQLTMKDDSDLDTRYEPKVRTLSVTTLTIRSQSATGIYWTVVGY